MGERGKCIYNLTCPGREWENAGPEGSESYKDISRFLGIGSVKVEVTLLKGQLNEVNCRHFKEGGTCMASGQEYVPCKYTNPETMFIPDNNQ